MTFQSSSGPLHNLYDYLVGKDHKTGEVENTHIAESWFVSEDARQLTFNLRENVPYYLNGKASKTYLVSPEDVRWTWLLQAGFESGKTKNSERWRPWLNSGDDIAIHDNYVVWNLDIILPDAGEYLSEDRTFGLISKQYWNDVGGENGYIDHPIGTGAFSFVEYIDYEHFLLERNIDHYRFEPYFDELQFLWVREPDIRDAMIRTHDIHLTQLSRYMLEGIESHGLKIAKSTLPSFFLWGAIPWYMPEDIHGDPTPSYDETVPTREVKVREALNLAIDRERINSAYFEGDAIPSAVPHMVERWDFFQDRWALYPGPGGNTGAAGGWPYPYDPQRARQLLTDAGYPDGFELDFLAPIDTGSPPIIPEVAEGMAYMWREIGIDMNLTISDHLSIEAMLTDRTMNGKVFLMQWPVLLPSDGMGELWRNADTPYYEYPFITEWKEQYDVTAHLGERDNMVQELGDFWYDNYLSIPLLWIFEKVVYNPQILERYEVNQLEFGPARYHEYTVPIYR